MNASDFQRVVFTLTRTPYYVETPARHCKNTKLLLHRYITCHSGVGITLHNWKNSNDCNLQNDILFVETLFVGFNLLPHISYLLLLF